MDDTRELRRHLERAQGDVKRLTRALDDATARRSSKDDGLAKEVARLEALSTRHEAHRAELERHWREREADWQRRERALRDELDELRREEKRTRRELERAEERLAKLNARVERLQAQRTPSKLLAPLRQALTASETKAELQTLRSEVVRLRRQLSLQQPRLRR